MLLNRDAVILRMMFFPRRLIAIDQDADRALPRTERHHHAPIRTNRHETGRRNQLDGQDKQRQRGQQAPRDFRSSDCPRHKAPLNLPRPDCHQGKLPQIALDVNVKLS
ncbi:hypothetical protein TomTYG75_17980 [Sphingobium sp. TomTYG75]